MAVGILAAMSPTARAHDSLAPRGAPHQWLPVEEWVFHWVPFDERVLTRALGLRSHELEAYLYNDHHTLADLARRRGIDLNELVTELLAPWGESVMERQKAVLRDHALRLLTQGHLAQHVLFHSFHTVGLKAATQRLFGVTHPRFRAPAGVPRQSGRRRGEAAGLACPSGADARSPARGIAVLAAPSAAGGGPR